LLALSAQVISGSFSADMGEFFGPFTDLVSETFVKSMTWYHKNPGQWALIGLTVLHVMAIAYYRWFNRIDLVRPMITGDKQLSEQVTASRDDATKRIVAIAVVVCCSLAVLWVLRWAAASAAPY
jgi:cytochrome b